MTSLRGPCREPFAGGPRFLYSLPRLAAHGFPEVARLPRVLRVILESLLRNCDGTRVQEHDVAALARWQAAGPRDFEIPFVVGRIVLQDVAGIPLLGDLAAMRDAMVTRGADPGVVRPRVPVDMVIDHSLEVDVRGRPDALRENMRIEIERNRERFAFVKWASAALTGVRVVPPGFGILHQVNLEFLSPGLLHAGDDVFPDTLLGTDSHSCMIAGLGVVGWGVGGIEAEAAMLGQPVPLLAPDVVAVDLRGALGPGVTATDLVLHLTRVLRREGVVGKFLEFTGAGTAALTVPDRATIANMAPEYGATIAFFPFDDETARYLRGTGRDEAAVADVARYWRQQGMDGDAADVAYTARLAIDLGDVEPVVAGPKRPQDEVPLGRVRQVFRDALAAPRERGGYGRPVVPAATVAHDPGRRRDGDVVIAAITSCTNTANPSVMLAAGLLARNAVARGLTVPPWVKTSLAPGSVVVARYLAEAGLQDALDALGFQVVGFGCATCVGNSGPLLPGVAESIREHGVVASAVLSGNRNFEGRIHPAVDAAWLASPPLVVAYALAGTVDVDFGHDPLGRDRDGRAVYLRDLWPDATAIAQMGARVLGAAAYRDVYGDALARGNDAWNAIAAPAGRVFPWDPASTFLRQPPYFTTPELAQSSLRDVEDARILALLGDSVTTDHISPIGAIARDSPAGRYLRASGVTDAELGSFGARRVNHEVMMRGVFGNRMLRNRMAPDAPGGSTRHWPGGDTMPIFDAAMAYRAEGRPVVVFAGKDYGMGSARDWAAKGVRLIGVRAVFAQGFERIHRSNLVGMGVLPCELQEGVDSAGLGLDGSELCSLRGLHDGIEPRAALTLVIRRSDGSATDVPVTLRLDTPAEVGYARRGGILPHVAEALAAGG
ncbi:MAG: aconitate hydratase AcnA [Burkholderiales bacterium]